MFLRLILRALNHKSVVPFRPSLNLKQVGKILGSTVGRSQTERGEYGDSGDCYFCKNAL